MSALTMVILALVAALAAGLSGMVVARHLALRHTAAAGGPPLSEAERVALRAWARRMMIVFVAAMAFIGLMTIALIALSIVGPRLVPSWVYWVALLVQVLIVAVAIGIQFSARCPRCGYNIGLQSRLVLPRTCERCQAGFR